MILSYSGFNYMNVPWLMLGDAYRGFDVQLAFNRLTRYSESPDWLKAFGEFFSGLTKNTSLSQAVRRLNVRRETEIAVDEYRQRFPTVEKDATQVVAQLAIPQYVHALQSMKRDFLGIPMVVAFQPYGLTEDSAAFKQLLDQPNEEFIQFAKDWRIDLTVGVDEYLSLYQRFMDESRSRLNGYLNEDWLFLDPHSYVREHLVGKEYLRDGIHFTDPVQEEVARFMVPDLFRFICGNAL